MLNRNETANTILQRSHDYASFELEMLKSLCSIDAGSGNLTGNQAVIDILSRFFQDADIPFETVEADGLGKHFLARIRPEHPKGKILLNAHLDTAFQPGDVEKNPVTIDSEGWLHGCGVSDCKGGVVISANAVRICKELNLLPDYEIVMIYNCDEEIGSPSGQRLFQKEAVGATCLYAFEPSREDDGILTSRMGHGVCHLEVSGRQAHPAMFWNGASATECLIKIAAALYQKQDVMKEMYFNFSEIESGPAEILSPHASATITFRINEDNPFEHTKAVLEEVFSQEYVPGCSVRYEIRAMFPYMARTDANVKLYEHMRNLGEQFMDWALPEQSTFGAGDACFFSSYGVPAICGLGTYMANPHTLQEKCRIDSLERRTALMALTLAFFDENLLKR